MHLKIISQLTFKLLPGVVEAGVDDATGVGGGGGGGEPPSSLSCWFLRAGTRDGVLGVGLRGTCGLVWNHSSSDISTNVVDSLSVCMLKSPMHFLLKSAKTEITKYLLTKIISSFMT